MNTCQKHSSYRGLKKPSGERADCVDCLMIYAEMLGHQVRNIGLMWKQAEEELRELSKPSGKNSDEWKNFVEVLECQVNDIRSMHEKAQEKLKEFKRSLQMA